MSEYQYFEFCRLQSPLTAKARQVMRSLSSRAQVGTHGASYVYHFGDFRGDPKKLLLDYFDVFFYIANWGTVQLMFNYPSKYVDFAALQKYVVEEAIRCEQHQQRLLIDVRIQDEAGFGWTEGEGLLANLLPLYDEIKAKNYQFLELAAAIHHMFTEGDESSLDKLLSARKLSAAQKLFLQCAGVEYEAKV